MNEKQDSQQTEQETVLRRDAALKRALTMPPDPKTPPKPKPGKEDSEARK